MVHNRVPLLASVYTKTSYSETAKLFSFPCVYSVTIFLHVFTLITSSTVFNSCPTTDSSNLRRCQFVGNSIRMRSIRVWWSSTPSDDSRTYYTCDKMFSQIRWLVYSWSRAAFRRAASAEKYPSVILLFFHRTGRMPHYASFVCWITIELDSGAHAVFTHFRFEIFQFVWMF